MSVNVNFDGGVYVDDIKVMDDFGGVGYLLRVEEEFVFVGFLVFVEVFEVVGGEVDRGSGGEVEVVRVEKIKEGILDDFGLYFEVVEVGVV